MKIAIGADHAGYQLKDSLKRLLDELGIAYEDFGTSSAQSVDYPDYARAVAEGVSDGKFDRGILVCGTGVGMSIAANKVAGVRSARARDRQDVPADAFRRRPTRHSSFEDRVALVRRA